MRIQKKKKRKKKENFEKEFTKKATPSQSKKRVVDSVSSSLFKNN
jgi:hypothetical protein